MALPQVIKGFNIYIEGENFICRGEEAKLPNIKVNGVDFRGAGMDAPIELDMGMEKLDVEMTLAEWTPSVIAKFGLMSAGSQLVIRGAMQQQGAQPVPFVIRMQGGINGIDRDALKSGERGSMKITANCNYYREEQAGAELIEIDIVNGVRRFGGVDQLAAIRAML